jgi:hypothetical protein
MIIGNAALIYFLWPHRSPPGFGSGQAEFCLTLLNEFYLLLARLPRSHLIGLG